MTDRLGRAVETVREVPAVGQASLAHTILRLAETGKPLDVEPGYRGAVTERATQAAQVGSADGGASDIVARAFQGART